MSDDLEYNLNSINALCILGFDTYQAAFVLETVTMILVNSQIFHFCRYDLMRQLAYQL